MDKKADNRIINTKKEISIVENDLSQTRKSLNELDYLEFNVSNIKRNLNECVELLNASVKNRRINNKFQDMANEANIYYGKTKSNFEDERILINERIVELNNRLDELDESLKKDLNELEDEKESNEEVTEEIEEVEE